jgi:hypothetical protein
MVFPLLPHHHNGTYKKLKLQEQDLQVTWSSPSRSPIA